ncbi:undecaprenyl-diphosphate phosphatase [Desulfovibrio aminophilus]|nr:undecaprenyl-diphosphate phosphatase [Desulfovibrio aminophilus]MCM0754392.1 undecaprenyl-diphosphate phosphatase [Desulfovibrio aminophilus]
MAPWYIAAALGLLEGLTEFLPVSSTGHLILAGHLMNFTGPKADTFDIAIQLGAILAVVVLYRDRFWGLVRPHPLRRFSGKRGILLLFLTTLPALVFGFLTHGLIKRYLFGPMTVALALFAGALFILAVELRRRRPKTYALDEIGPGLALGIGLFQCLALWPGFSRAGATIMGAMILGAERKTAAEYSFLAAVPVMCAAVGYDLLKNWRLFESGDMVFLAIGFAVSFVSAWAAVKTFIGMLSRFTLRPFAWYRLALAPLVWLFWKP